MATQMAATPTLKGKDAKRLLDSLKSTPSVQSKQNGRKLIEFFKAIEDKRK